MYYRILAISQLSNEIGIALSLKIHQMVLDMVQNASRQKREFKFVLIHITKDHFTLKALKVQFVFVQIELHEPLLVFNFEAK